MKVASPWGFAASVLALTGILYFTQAVKAPEAPAVPPTPAPASGTVLRVGFFEIGPEDLEPVLAHEVIAGIPGRIAAEDIVGEPPSRSRGSTTSLNFGVNFSGQPLSRADADPVETTDERFSAGGSAERLEDGSYALSLRTARASTGASHQYGTENRLREGEVLFLSGPGFSGYEGGWWMIQFVLARIAPPGEAGGTLESWRSAIVRSCSDPALARGFPRGKGMGGAQALHNGVRGAALIACPEARDALAALQKEMGAPLDPSGRYLARELVDLGELERARLMAGSPAGTCPARNESSYREWPALAAYLKYDTLRELLRPAVQRFIDEQPPGRAMAARLAKDPALKVPEAVSPDPPWLKEHIGGIFAASIFGLFAALFFASALRSSADLRSAASLLSAGCLLSLFGLKFNQINPVQLAALIMIAVGVARLAGALAFRTPAVRIALAATAALLACQTWMLLGAPSGVESFADAVHDGLPLMLLAALGPAIGEAAGASWALLKTHAAGTAVPAASILLWKGINAAAGTGNAAELNPAVVWGLLGLGIVAAGTGPIGWWGLRKRLKAVAQP